MKEIKKVYKMMVLKIKSNRKIAIFSLVFLFLYYLIFILGNFIEYNSYKDDIQKYDLMQYEDLGFFVRDSTLQSIDILIEQYKENDILLEVAYYLELDTSEIVNQVQSVAQQNIELVQLIHTKDENYYYHAIEVKDNNYVSILILLLFVIIVIIKRKKILKYIYTNIGDGRALKIRRILKYKKYIIILFLLIITIFTIYFGSNLVEYKSYEEDINKYNLTKYQDLGLLLKNSTLENIQEEIAKQQKLEDLVTQAEEMGINVNEILLPSITNTDDKINLITDAINNYETKESSSNINDSDNDGVEDSTDICDSGDDKVDENNNEIPDACDDLIEEDVSYDETTPVYYEDEQTSDNSSTSEDNCNVKKEDCNGEGEIDSPPNEPAECDSETQNCDGEDEIDTPAEPPVEEVVCDPIIEDCDGDGSIDNPPPVEPICDPITSDCDGDGNIDTPPEIEPMMVILNGYKNINNGEKWI